MKQRKLQGSCENSSRPFFQYDATFAAYIEQYNLTKNQLKVLFYLRYSRRAWHTLKTPVKCLAEVLNMALSSVYAALARLSALGLIKVNKYVQTATDCRPWAINWVQSEAEQQRANAKRKKTVEKQAAQEEKAKAEAAKAEAAKAEAAKAEAAKVAQEEAAKFIRVTAPNQAVTTPNQTDLPSYLQDPRERDEQGNIRELKFSPEGEALRAKILKRAEELKQKKEAGYDFKGYQPLNRPTS
jgi:Fe2+ or Zn2+ uptake regulation protein